MRSPFPLKLLLIGLFVYLSMQVLVVGMPTISGSSEAREALVVDVIVRDGSWLLPLRNGAIPSKPPLFHWLAAVGSLVAGEVSEFSVRLTSQVAAVFVMLLVGIVAYRFTLHTNPRLSAAHPRRSALLAVGITSITYGFFVMANQAMVDMTFTLCVWGALASLVGSSESLWVSRRRISRRAKCGFFLFCGLGVLARGPLGFLLPVFLAFIIGWVCLGFRGSIRELLRYSVGWSFLLLPITWYFVAYQQGGDAFLERQIFFENVKRFSGGDFVNSETWWFYGPSFLRTTFPWGALMVFLIYRGARSGQTLSYPFPTRPVRWLPSIVCISGILLFSSSSGKRHSYLLPLLPLVSIQLASEVSRLYELAGDAVRDGALRAARRLMSVNTWAALVILGGTAAISGFTYELPSKVALALPPLLGVTERFGPVMVMVVAIGAFFARKCDQVVFQSLWFQYAALLTFATNGGAAVKGHLKGFDQMAAVWDSLATDGAKLAVMKHPFDEYFDPMLYYVKRPVRVVSTESNSLQCDRGFVYVARRNWLEARRGMRGLQITTGTVLRERLLAISQDERFDLVAFRCDGVRGSTPQEVNPPAMREAGFRMPPAVPNDPAT